jgi:hypothetical protein
VFDYVCMPLFFVPFKFHEKSVFTNCMCVNNEILSLLFHSFSGILSVHRHCTTPSWS